MSTAVKIRSSRQAPYATRKNAESFWDQPIVMSRYLYLPEAYETLFLAAYLLLLPYLTGLLFIFLFIARNDAAHFVGLDLMLFIPVWSIGYETLAGLTLLGIFYSGITFYLRKRSVAAQ
jgi:hypothetical protein